MSVAFDAASASAGQQAASLPSYSWTHTPGGTPTAVGVMIQNEDWRSAVTGVTYGGVSMALAVSLIFSSSSESVQIWGLPNPPAGAQTVQVTNAGGIGDIYATAGAITVTGSDTTTCFDLTNSATGTGTTATCTLTTVSGELVIDVVFTGGATPTVSGSGQVLRWGPNHEGVNDGAGSSAPSGSSSTTMSWTIGSSQLWAQALAAFKVASTAGLTLAPQTTLFI